MGSRSRLGDALPEVDYTYLSDNGEMPIRECGRYVRPTLDIAAGTAWSYVQGIDVDVARGGWR
jgi:hypothetical protein